MLVKIKIRIFFNVPVNGYDFQNRLRKLFKKSMFRTYIIKTKLAETNFLKLIKHKKSL